MTSKDERTYRTIFSSGKINTSVGVESPILCKTEDNLGGVKHENNLNTKSLATFSQRQQQHSQGVVSQTGENKSHSKTFPFITTQTLQPSGQSMMQPPPLQQHTPYQQPSMSSKNSTVGR